jgi:hypothetical protein
MRPHTRATQDRSSVITLGLISPRLAQAALRGIGGLCAGAFILAGAARLRAGRLDAHYEATLSGIPVGKGAWTIDIGGRSVFGGRPAAPRGC